MFLALDSCYSPGSLIPLALGFVGLVKTSDLDSNKSYKQ